MILFQQKQLRFLPLSFILFALFTLSLSSCSKGEKRAKEERTAVIFFTNDSHGRVTPDANNTSMIGVDYIAAIKKSTPDALLVDVGDTFHGLPIALEGKGENIATLYNEIPYDLIVPGNHDFNYGTQQLLALSKQIKFPMICANILKEDTNESLLPKGIILTSGGIKIGFIGISTKEIALTASVKDITIKEYSVSTLETAQELKEQGAEVLVVLAHISRKESKELAALCKNHIDLIIDAHNHTTTFDKVGDIQIIQAGAHGKYIGEAKITLNPNGEIQNISARLINEEEAHTSYTPLAPITTILKNLVEALMEKLSEVIGTSHITLSAYRGNAQTPGVRNSEQPFGNLLADATRIYTNTNIALINGGEIRADILPGNITKYNILSTSPFYSYVVVKNLSPYQLRQVFEVSLASYPDAFGGFFQISGCALEFDSSKPAGSRVKRIIIGTNEVDLNNTVSMYSVSMNDYIASGGDGYELFTTIPPASTEDAINVMYEKHIATISPLTESNTGMYGRIIDVAKQ